jgi:TfoX/Sxy family transcriptional regulator of competence genes
MPKWKPAPSDLTERFAKALEQVPDAKPRKMFGYLAGFVGGQMFAGTFEDSIIFRLPEPDRAKFLRQFEAKPFAPMPGRVMREYVQVDGAAIESDKLLRWLEKAAAYTATLPPKKKKKK